MGLFKRKKKQDSLITLPKPSKEELRDLAEMANLPMQMRINDAIQKQVDASIYYEAFEHGDTQGNYFGAEFDIRATAGRIKATYAKEPWIYATASLMARALTSVPFVVERISDGEILPDHALNEKINSQSDLEDTESIEWKEALDMVLGGNAYRVFDSKYKVSYLIPVEMVTLKLSEDRRSVAGLLILDHTGTNYSSFIPSEQVVHYKYPNPYSPFFGMSLFTAASRPLLLDRYKNEFEMAFYLRGATNAGVIETTEDINKTRMERLMRTFEQVYTGRRNWWRSIFLPKGAKWVSSGLTMSEMQHLEGLKENRLTLLAVVGVAPSQVGIVQDVNRSTAESQERTFWQNTIMPLARFKAAGWNNSYLVKHIYQGKVRVVPDFSGIEALQGSLITRGEQAKSVERYLLIDEIREDILGYEALPNGKGQVFAGEIQRLRQDDLGLSLSVETPEQLEPVAEEGVVSLLSLKDQAVEAQDRLENRLGKDYVAAYGKYMNVVYEITERALAEEQDVESALKGSVQELARVYIRETEEVLVRALERGFLFANSQSKTLTLIRQKFKTPSTKRLRFSQIDQEAIEFLREEQRDGKREALLQRSIEHFLGFNETRSKEILDIVADFREQGQTAEQIAAQIRARHGEVYGQQAFTIARTELLTAISQGIKWNQEILEEVFTEVEKQWFHVGDAGSNPQARQDHAAFEQEGPVAASHRWGGILEYPRDPQAPADETINCRCSMVSFVPDSAQSNAEVILDRQ